MRYSCKWFGDMSGKSQSSIAGIFQEHSSEKPNTVVHHQSFKRITFIHVADSVCRVSEMRDFCRMPWQAGESVAEIVLKLLAF